MAKIEVYNGDLESALRQLKRSSEESIAEYKKRLVFASPAAKRRKQKHIAELKRKRRDKRRTLRQEEKRRQGKDD